MRERERDGERAGGREGERKRCRRIYVLFYLKILKRGGNSSKGWTHCICLALEGVSEFCHTVTNPASSHPGCARLMAEKPSNRKSRTEQPYQSL